MRVLDEGLLQEVNIVGNSQYVIEIGELEALEVRAVSVDFVMLERGEVGGVDAEGPQQLLEHGFLDVGVEEHPDAVGAGVPRDGQVVGAGHLLVDVLVGGQHVQGKRLREVGRH